MLVEKLALNEALAWLLQLDEIEHRISHLGALAAHRLDHRVAAEGHIALRITALMRDDDPPAADIVGEREHLLHHPATALAVELHARQWIDPAPIIAAGDDDQLRRSSDERHCICAWEDRAQSARLALPFLE